MTTPTEFPLHNLLMIMTHNRFLGLLLLPFVVSCIPVFDSNDYELVWSEEFDGDAINWTRWKASDNCQDNDESPALTCPMNRTDNLYLENGWLKIKATPEEVGTDKKLRINTARIKMTNRSKEEGENNGWQFGYFEIRVLFPAGSPFLFPSIYLVPEKNLYGSEWPVSGQIVIGQLRGQETNLLESCLWFGIPSYYPTVTSGFNEYDDFGSKPHRLGVEWTNISISWFVDDEKSVQYPINKKLPSRGVENKQTYDHEGAPFDNSFLWELYMPAGGPYFSNYGDLTFEKAKNWTRPTLEIDYVRVYQRRPDRALKQKDNTDNRVIIIIIVFSAILPVILIIIIVICYKKWKKGKQTEDTIPIINQDSVTSATSAEMTHITNRISITSLTDDSNSMARRNMCTRFIEETGVLKKLISSGKLIDNKFLTLDDKIGSGHFGDVFRGILQENQEESGSQEANKIKPMSVAVKCLRREFCISADCEMFVKEALVMRELDHPHIITLIGVSFESNGLPQVITPFMPNGDLLTYLRNQSSTHVKVSDLLVFGIEIASGMEYLSSKNIIHRDLAARNCLLDDSFHVRIGDFGLARDTYDKGYYRTGGDRMLPMKWIALECLQGRSVFTTESDIWSYGVCFWEIMCRGVEPYQGTDARVLEHFLTQGRRLERPKYCSKEVYEIMLRCWSNEPKERTSFKEILTAIQNYMSSVGWSEKKLPRVRPYVKFPAVDKNVRTNPGSSLEKLPVNYVAPYFE